MKTSCFFQYQGPGRISIARFAPRNLPAGYRVYKALAPADGKMLKMAYEPYRELFMEQLNGLNAKVVYDDLQRLAAGAEPVLLCWEDLTKPGQWCHRRMVAEWLHERLGIQVPELEIASAEEQRKIGF